MWWIAFAAPRPDPRSVFVGGDRFHQRHQLTLHRLILDLAVGAQQPEAERAVEEQQALDFAGLVVAVVEEGDRHIQRRRDLLKAGSADTIDALLVLLNLLEADAKLVAEFGLRDLLLDTRRRRIRLPNSMSGLPALRCFIFFAADLFILVTRPSNRESLARLGQRHVHDVPR
ncbi:hypothetical protein ABIF02_001188 [Bradyrhizobium elkanii]